MIAESLCQKGVGVPGGECFCCCASLDELLAKGADDGAFFWGVANEAGEGAAAGA